MYADVNVRSTALNPLLIARQEQAVRRLEHQRRHCCERTQDQNSTAVFVARTPQQAWQHVVLLVNVHSCRCPSKYRLVLLKFWHFKCRRRPQNKENCDICASLLASAPRVSKFDASDPRVQSKANMPCGLDGVNVVTSLRNHQPLPTAPRLAPLNFHNRCCSCCLHAHHVLVTCH
jgi:hypothetical protein